MNESTFNQAYRMLGLVPQYGLQSEHLSTLEQTGLLKDLLEATRDLRLEDLNPFKVRAALGLKEGAIRVVPGFKVKITLTVQDTPSYLFEQSGLPRDDMFNFLEDSLFQDVDSCHEATFRLFAVNRVGVGLAEESLSEAGIIPAGRRELLKFACLNPMLPGNRKDILGIGSTKNFTEVPRVRSHPALRYNHELKGSSLVTNETCIENDGSRRHYFIGRYVKGHTDTEE